jgi:cell division septal protein FtsQ
MIRPTRPSAAIKTVLSLVCIAFGALLVAAPSLLAAETTVHYQKESLQEYEKQLAGGQIQTARVNKKARSIRLRLNDGRHVLVKYGAGQEPTYVAQLRAKGISVTILQPAQASTKAKKPVKHKLRYIAGGLLIVVVIVVGAVLLIDRKRKLSTEQPPRSAGDAQQ